MKSFQRLIISILTFLSLERPGHAQIPLGSELRITQPGQIIPKGRIVQDYPDVAALHDGSFAVVWTEVWIFEGTLNSRYAAARFYGPDGEPLTETVYFVDPPGAKRSSNAEEIAAGQTDRYHLFASHYPGDRIPTEILIRTYSETGQPLRGVDPTLPDVNSGTITEVAVAPSGRLAVAWIDTDSAPGRAAWLSPSGRFSTPFFEGITAGKHGLSYPFLGIDRSGSVIIAGDECLEGPVCGVYAQRYNRFGIPVGSTLRITERVDGVRKAYSVAVAPDGRFLVAWNELERDFSGNATIPNIFARVFDPSDRPLTGDLRIGRNRELPDIDAQAAADPHGNFILVYSRVGPVYDWCVMGELIRKDGQRVGPPFRVSTNGFTHPKVAFGGNGTFVAVWEAFDGSFDGVFGQRFLAAEGEEICAVDGAELRCDGARSGGAPEWTVGLDGGQIVTGDVDRDGREDACVFARGEFRCDTDHRGLPYEMTLRFGSDGDVALWGDVDGDGRGEACVRRGTTVSCDTGHNGGRGELNVQVGQAADLPLLGDVNGDRREDVCVYQAAGRFVCVLSRSGKSWSVSFGGQAGDVAALGDFNGDGKADPCVWRQGELLCDTAQNGGTSEARLAMPDPGARLLFANVDGL